jgi:hypothetical protein
MTYGLIFYVVCHILSNYTSFKLYISIRLSCKVVVALDRYETKLNLSDNSQCKRQNQI